MSRLSLLPVQVKFLLLLRKSRPDFNLQINEVDIDRDHAVKSAASTRLSGNYRSSM